ncbi:hypothetical protein ACHWQZ_G000449 [Mnemiopsis leidyi]
MVSAKWVILLAVLSSASTYQNENPWEAILYGYVVDPDSPNFLNKGDVIFEIPDGSHDDLISISSQSTILKDEVYSDSSESASKKVAASMSVKGSYGAFSAAASMSVSSSIDSSIKTVRLDAYIKAIKYEVSSKNAFRTRPEDFLTQNFKDAVKRLPVEEIEKLIGVFYARQMNLGGEVRKSYTMQATSEDTAQSVKAEVSGGGSMGLFSASASASTGVSTRSSNENAAMKTEWHAKGGETTVWLGADLGDDGNMNTIQEKWANTIEDSNLYQFDFELRPMWDLVKAADQKKGEEFQKHLETKWKIQGEEFSPSMFLDVDEGEWTPLSNSNQDGQSIWYSCPRGRRVTKLTWYQNSLSSLVDVAMECGDDSNRFTNSAGSANRENVCMDGFSRIQGLENEEYGIMNVRMNCIGSNDYMDSNSNRNGRWNPMLSCSEGVFTGLEVRVKSGSENGIINFKALCTNLPKDTECWERQDKENKGSGYRGTQSETIMGEPCKTWKYTKFRESKYADKGILDNHNYCRNPEAKYLRNWCYTTNSWNYCPVRTCGENVGCWETSDRIRRGDGYRGTQSRTRNGYTCKNWRETSYYNSKFYGKGIGNHNYCRNPDNKYNEVWCYTVDGSRWDYCDVPACKKSNGKE